MSDCNNSKPLKTVYNTSIAFLVIILLVMFGLVMTGIIKKTFGKTDSRPVTKNEIAEVEKYYQPIDRWTTPENKEYKYQVSNNNFIDVTGTNKCRTYTYENIFIDRGFKRTFNDTEATTPNFNNVFIDYFNGFNHIGGDHRCLSEDQLKVVNNSKTCKTIAETSYNACYTVFGEEVSVGTSIGYTTHCETQNNCEGFVSNISLNFELGENQKINSNTRCINIDKIKVPSKIFNDNNFDYYKSIGILQLDKTLPNDTTVYPIQISSQYCNTKRTNQKFLVTNHRFEKTQEKTGNESKTVTKFVPDVTGLYTSLEFKPLNSYLDIIFEDSGGIAELSITKGGSGYALLDEYSLTAVNPTIGKGTGGKVVASVVNDSGEITSLTLSQQGEDYSIGTCYNLVAVGGISPPTTEAEVIITNIYKTNPKYVLRLNNSDNLTENVKWISMPSLDLSKARFPTQQRCNLVNPIKGNDGNSIIPEFLTKSTVFNKSNLSGGKINMERGYCSKTIDFYPTQNFRVETQNCRVNPFNFYNYSVRTTKGNQPNQKNKNPFVLVKKQTGRVFSTGEVFQDGDCDILVQNATGPICSFPVNYFKNTGNGVLTFLGKTDGQPHGKYYKDSDIGLISTFTVTQQPADQVTYKTGTYTNISPVSVTGKGEGATFDIDLRAVYQPNQNIYAPRVELKTTDQGKDYNTGDVLTFSGTSIGLNSDYKIQITEVEMESFTFVSIPMNSKYQLAPDPINASENDFPNRGFVVEAQLQSVGAIEFAPTANSAGFGMELNRNIYFYQTNTKKGELTNNAYYNNLVEFLKTPQTAALNRNTTTPINNKLIYATPTSIQDVEYSGNLPAPASLGINQGTKLGFNFLNYSDMVLSPSPPQLVYGGEIISNNKILVEVMADLGINETDDVENFFINNKNGIDTNITFIKSLQYTSLNYSEENNNSVENKSEIVLGKFIPYSNFTSMRIRNGNLPDPETIDKTYYNYNRFQLIPYGLNNVYQAKIGTQ